MLDMADSVLLLFLLLLNTHTRTKWYRCVFYWNWKLPKKHMYVHISFENIVSQSIFFSHWLLHVPGWLLFQIQQIRSPSIALKSFPAALPNTKCDYRQNLMAKIAYWPTGFGFKFELSCVTCLLAGQLGNSNTQNVKWNTCNANICECKSYLLF